MNINILSKRQIVIILSKTCPLLNRIRFGGERIKVVLYLKHSNEYSYEESKYLKDRLPLLIFITRTTLPYIYIYIYINGSCRDRRSLHSNSKRHIVWLFIHASIQTAIYALGSMMQLPLSHSRHDIQHQASVTAKGTLLAEDQYI